MSHLLLSDAVQQFSFLPLLFLIIIIINSSPSNYLPPPFLIFLFHCLLNCSVYSLPEPTIHHKTVPGVRLHLEDEEMINSNINMTNDEERSKIGEEVKLLSVDLDTEGIYRCVVTTEPFFQIVRQLMTVAVFSESLTGRVYPF